MLNDVCKDGSSPLLESSQQNTTAVSKDLIIVMMVSMMVIVIKMMVGVRMMMMETFSTMCWKLPWLIRLTRTCADKDVFVGNVGIGED